MNTLNQPLCPVCGNTTTALENNLSRCGRCLHIFETDLKATCSYDATYLETYIHHTTCDTMSAARAGIVLGTLKLPIGSKILDIGYANGAFLKAMEHIGYDVYGMDLHGKDMGIREVKFDTPIVYDLVCFFDSIEHFENPKTVYQLQTHSVIISLPMRPSFFPAYPQKWKHYKPGEHLHYFSPESLDYFMRGWGMTRRIASGNPEDIVRGRLTVDGLTYPNIYTAVYTR